MCLTGDPWCLHGAGCSCTSTSSATTRPTTSSPSSVPLYRPQSHTTLVFASRLCLGSTEFFGFARFHLFRREQSSRGRRSLIICPARAHLATSAPAPAPFSGRARLGPSYFRCLVRLPLLNKTLYLGWHRNRMCKHCFIKEMCQYAIDIIQWNCIIPNKRHLTSSSIADYPWEVGMPTFSVNVFVCCSC